MAESKLIPYAEPVADLLRDVAAGGMEMLDKDQETSDPAAATESS